MFEKCIDKRKREEYSARAKAVWGETAAYQEYEIKSAGRSRSTEQILGAQLMEIFAEFSKIKTGSPDSEAAQKLVRKLQSYITENYYTCTDEILLGLGEMYSDGGDFTVNIDRYAGEGTAAFAARSIEEYILAK